MIREVNVKEITENIKEIRTWNKNTESASGKLSDSRQ